MAKKTDRKKRGLTGNLFYCLLVVLLIGVATYPFISSSIFDESGIFCGTNIYNDSLVFIDKYNQEKYKNANMCIFGTSGSRKIFLYKINDTPI